MSGDGGGSGGGGGGRVANEESWSVNGSND